MHPKQWPFSEPLFLH